MLNDDRLDPPPDLLRYATILVLLIAAGIALVLAAADTGIPGLKHLAEAVALAGIALHLIKVGRVY